jgi:hypothetical protein
MQRGEKRTRVSHCGLWRNNMSTVQVFTMIICLQIISFAGPQTLVVSRLPWPSS